MLECSTPKELLALILISGGVLAALAISPALLAPAILIKQARNDKNRQSGLRNAYNYVKQNGLVQIKRDRSGNPMFILTQKGRIAALRHHVKDLQAQYKGKKQHWDTLWRIFIFDVPTTQANKRSALRYFIKRLGMVQLQKSVWVYPYDCSRQLHFVKEIFNLSDIQARLIISSDIGDDRKLRKRFSLP